MAVEFDTFRPSACWCYIFKKIQIKLSNFKMNWSKVPLNFDEYNKNGSSYSDEISAVVSRDNELSFQTK